MRGFIAGVEWAISECEVEETPFSCNIHINAPNGKYCCNQYNGPVDVHLVVHSEPTSDIKIRGIGLNESTTGNPSKEVNGIEAIYNYNPYGTAKIVGIVEYGPKDGPTEKEYCYKEIKVDECTTNSCKISQPDSTYNNGNKTRYILTAVSPFGGSGTTYYAKTSSRSSYYQKLGREDGKYVYYVTQKEAATTNEKNSIANRAFDIVGRVENSNGCGLCCRDNIQYKTEYSSGCTTDLQDLKTYCSNNYRRDKNCFETYEECITHYYYSCACPVFSISSNLDSLKSWCSNTQISNPNLWPSVNECVQKCCQDQVKCATKGIEDEIIYRPIDNTCPFPNSYIGKGTSCEQGDRLIGKNWIGQTELITDVGDQVYDRRYNEEYVIELNQEAVKTIQTRYAYDSNGMTKYYVYEDARGEIDTCNEGIQNGLYYSGYCSTFIHKSGLFGKIRSIQRKDIYSYQDNYKNWDYFSVFCLNLI